MTIAAGFVCTDGLLFASDTLYASEKQTYGPKFWAAMREGVTVVFGGAGTETGLKRTRDEIEQTIQPGMDRFAALKCIEAALLYVNQQMAPDPNDRTYALIGLRIGEKCWLYENQNGGAALTLVDTASKSVGSGYALGSYLGDVLFHTNMPIRWAKVVAAHLVKSVKTHSPVWCGGNTHLLELPTTGFPKRIEDPKEIERYESHLQQVDDAMRIVLPDGQANDETIELRLKTIATAISKASKSHAIHLSPATLQITSGSSNVIAAHIPTPRISYGNPEDE